MEYLQTVHHEMGHIEYFMQYCPLPMVFHNGANSAFHEAIGDTVALSVMSPKHLKTIGLLTEEEAGSKEEGKSQQQSLSSKWLAMHSADVWQAIRAHRHQQFEA